MKQTIDKIIASFESEPDQWVYDNYDVTHKKNGISVWLCNGHYGLDVKIGRERVYGGVTMMSSLFGPLIPWRRRLRRAAMRMVRDRVNRRIREALA